jgi:hypothetical protein
MSLIESARRSASIIADEQVVCYELLRDGFTKMLAEHPAIATKLLTNLARAITMFAPNFGRSSQPELIVYWEMRLGPPSAAHV